MSAASAVCSRCADAAHQRGAAVVMAMLTVALAAGLAAAALASVDAALESSRGRHDQAQARLLARAAIDWARAVLADDALRGAADHPLEPWAIRVPPMPVPGADDLPLGELGGEIDELSGRFNLNNLAPGGRPDRAAATAFETLLGFVAVPPAQAALLAATLQDAVDSDRLAADGKLAEPAGLPDAPLLQVEELGRLPGFDAALLQRLRPIVAALPAPSRINVNTAPAEVLAACLPGLGLDRARALVARRRAAWARDLADLAVLLPDDVAPPDPQRLAVRSTHFLVTARARHGVAMVRLEALLERFDAWPEILWQRLP
jgi:general secretion pathway protein K